MDMLPVLAERGMKMGIAYVYERTSAPIVPRSNTFLLFE